MVDFRSPGPALALATAIGSALGMGSSLAAATTVSVTALARRARAPADAKRACGRVCGCARGCARGCICDRNLWRLGMLTWGMGLARGGAPAGAASGKFWRGAVPPHRVAGSGSGSGGIAPPVFPGLWVGRSPGKDPVPWVACASAPRAQTWAQAVRVLHDAGCCVVRNARGAVSVTAGGIELNYRQLPRGPIRQAWNTLSVDEPEDDFPPGPGPAH